MTPRVVCYNLDETKFVTVCNGVVYYFSSKLHLDKFKSKINKNRDLISESLSNRFKMFIFADLIADLTLYQKIECRGFKVTIQGTDYYSLGQIPLKVSPKM